jgi:para-aminobenzoate synthetase component 1
MLQNADPIEQMILRIEPESLMHWASTLPGGVYLRSGSGGRYDIFTAHPESTLAWQKDQSGTIQDVLAWASAQQPHRQPSGVLPFVSGLIGCTSYEWAASLHGIQPQRFQSSRLPTLSLAYYSWSYVYDHQSNQGYLSFGARCDSTLKNQVKRLLLQHTPTPRDSGESPSHWHRTLDFDAYRARFFRARQYIAQGDVYQVNLAQRLEAHYRGSAEALFAQLHARTRTPYSALMNFGTSHLLSFSPEQFISVNQGCVTTRPIKGTIPNRGRAGEISELAHNAKNRAENVMIVDLMRNDLSRFCQAHTVRVPRLCEVETFPNVHHLVSTIEGVLSPEFSPLQVYLGSLPGGSITGAPKRRAIEIIDELELGGRDAYCGGIFYASDDGRFDSNILIRSIVKSDDSLFCWGGGGIVADSVCEEEYAESLVKVQNLTGVRTL